MEAQDGLSPGPGAYGIAYTPKLRRNDLYSLLYRPFAGQFLYFGKAGSTGLAARLGWHAQRLSEVQGLGLTNLSYATLPTRTKAFASFVEGTLLEQHDGRMPWNDIVPGFGCRNVGKSRSAQKVTRWDALHPGRYWCHGAEESLNQRALSALELARNVLGSDRD